MQLVTTDYVEYTKVRNAINAVLAEIMHERIDAKYAPKFREPQEPIEVFDWDDYAM
jgi:hypothetical protein